jgi:hypothetical protein
MSAFHYACGTEVCEGDHILESGHANLVEHVYAPNSQQAHDLGFPEGGIMIAGDKYGRIFFGPPDRDGWSELEFVRRRTD